MSASGRSAPSLAEKRKAGVPFFQNELMDVPCVNGNIIHLNINELHVLIVPCAKLRLNMHG